MKKKLIFIMAAAAIILGFLYWKFAPNFSSQTEAPAQEITLTYWGLWEDDSAIRPAIDAYKKIKPNVTIRYAKQNIRNYRKRLQTQIRSGQGPDIFRIHSSWLPMLGKDLSVMPNTTMNLSDFEAIFYSVAKETLVADGKIYALPLTIDGLALYYNEDLLKNAGITNPPATWQEFIELARKMTVIDTAGQIQTAGAAIGTTGNIDFWSDILGLLISEQPNGNLVTPANKDGADAVSFYTSFTTNPQRKTWDKKLPSAIQMFQEGRLGFYFAPSWRALELRQANPSLKFKTAPVPQLPGKKVAWGSFWVETVSNKSANPEEAWEFLKFLTSAETQRLLYTNLSQTRLLGEPYSRQDLAPLLISDPIAGSYVSQGAYYKSWYLNALTFDDGINDQIIKYYEDAVNATVDGAQPQDVLQTTQRGIEQVLSEYQFGARDVGNSPTP